MEVVAPTPPEILMLIFERLDALSLAKVSRSCRAWRDIARPLIRSARLREGYIEVVAEFEEPASVLDLVAWDGLVVACLANGDATLHSIASGRLIATLPGASGRAIPAGDLLMTVSTRGRVALWSREGALVTKFRYTAWATYACCAWDDAIAIALKREVVIATRAGDVVARVPVSFERQFPKFEYASMETWADLLLVWTDRHFARVYDRSGEKIRGTKFEYSYPLNVTCHKVCDDEMVVGVYGGRLFAWTRDGRTRELEHVLCYSIEAIASCSDGTIAASDRYGTIATWNPKGEVANVVSCDHASHGLISWSESIVFATRRDGDNAMYEAREWRREGRYPKLLERPFLAKRVVRIRGTNAIASGEEYFVVSERRTNGVEATRVIVWGAPE